MKLPELEMLIHKYLSGQATEEEKAIITQWLQHNPDERITDLQKKRELMTAIWGNVYNVITQPATSTEPAVVRSIGWLQKKYWVRIAASLFFIAMTGMLVYYFTRESASKSIQYAARNSYAREHILPDGSTVWIFPGSSIQVPENFNTKNRHVQVTGRAFFDVKQNAAKPFYVDAGKLQTLVLGTSFEVNTLRAQHPAVMVKTGRVAVSWDDKQLSQLSFNKRITLDLSGATAHATTDSVNAAALCTWWSGAFNFEQSPLSEVLQNLGEWYKFEVRTEGEKWKKEKLTIQIETQLSIHDAMRLLCETIGAQYKINGSTIIIY